MSGGTKGRSMLLSWFYAAILSGATLSCPVTAFELPVPLGVLWLVCAAASGLLALLWHLPGRAVTLSCAALAWLAALWHFRDAVLSGLSVTLETVTDLYARAYPGWTAVVLLSDAQPSGAALFFAALAVPLAAGLVWSLLQQSGVWLQALICGPWLGLCLVVVDCLPALWAILALLAALLLLALTRDARRQGAKDGLRLTALLSLPTVLALLLLIWLQPPRAYERAQWPDTLREQLNHQITRLSGLEFDRNGSLRLQSVSAPELLWTAEHEDVDLSALKDRRTANVTVMEVYADTTERVYLRGSSLTEYSDNAWHTAALSTPLAPLEPDGEAEHSLRIQTRTAQKLLYTPYYPVDVAGSWLNDAYYYNTSEASDYTVAYQPAPGRSAVDRSYTNLIYNVYCQLPEDTADALLSIAEEAGLSELSREEQPDAVAVFVRRTARYSPTPDSMPEGADFPVWFLTEAEKGYCVHYATATAALLRALGIPARYVTGFVAETSANRWVQVTDRDAHAWVEYWRDDFGWVPLESTPGGSRVAGTLVELSAEPETPDPSPDPEETEPELPDVPRTPDGPEQDEARLQQSGTAGHTQPGRSWAWLGWTLLGLAVLAGLIGSRWLRLWLRQRRIRGTANQQALALWRELERLARHSGAQLPPELKALAQRARFSQHSLTAEELSQLRGYAARLTEVLRRDESLWHRFRNRWLWADC